MITRAESQAFNNEHVVALLPVLAGFVKKIAAKENATLGELEAMTEVAKMIFSY